MALMEEEEEEKWGTRTMGAPARPTAHPANQTAAMWCPRRTDEEYYVHHLIDEAQMEKNKTNTSTITTSVDNALEAFNNWSLKAHDFANHLWHNLKTSPRKEEGAWRKLKLTVKGITKGGFESLYKQTFPTKPDEKLNDTFACYLSTTTGAVAGTLFISDLHVAFCSDRPLSFNAPSGQLLWSYYKIMIPLGRIASANPVTSDGIPAGTTSISSTRRETYIGIDTVDGREFWFMGFINLDSAYQRLQQALAHNASTRLASQEV
ncbi:putative GEM-like protein [Dioscorea sansibarensis]